ncbi:MAG: prolyl-tRNA synthetase associated domain-containing protein [Nanoarchaeota archaeon]
MEENLKKYLSKNNVKYVIHEHKAVFTVNESKNDLKIKSIPGIRTKSLFLKDKDKNFYLICLPGNKRLNTKCLKEKLNVNELHFASPEELKSQLNLMPGSVSIFGMINAKNVTLIIDEDVWQANITGFHPNINTATLEIKHEDLEKFVHSLNCKQIIVKLPDG